MEATPVPIPSLNPPSQDDIKAEDRTFTGAGPYLLPADFPSLSKGPEDSAFPTPGRILPALNLFP